MRPLLAPTTPVESLTLTFVDVETTGLDVAQGDRVCEVALLQVRHMQEIARFNSMLYPGRPMPAKATSVNGITDAMLAAAPLFSAILPTIRNMLHDTVLVAHNAQFDVRFLRYEFARAQQTFPQMAVIDTLALAQAWYTFPHNSLAAIASALGLSNIVRHRAMADVLTTWEVWQRFIAERQTSGLLTLAHLMHPNDSRTMAELEVLTATLYEGLSAHLPLRLHYKASNAEETRRVIQPLELQYAYGHSYLRAYCHMRRDERHFRLDRIMALERLTEVPRQDD
jgi:DNA polymerase-3 subunit epsilon